MPGAGHNVQHGAGDSPPEHLAARGRDDAIVIAWVQLRMSRCTRAGQPMATSWAIMPPIDIPKTSARSMPRPSSTATASAASCAVV